MQIELQLASTIMLCSQIDLNSYFKLLYFIFHRDEEEMIEPAYSTYIPQNNNLNGYPSNSLNSRNGKISTG